MAQEFNPREHLIKMPRKQKQKDGSYITIQNDYLEVKWRLVWFRSDCPNGQIETEAVQIADEMAIFRATVRGKDGASATGYKCETKTDWGDFIEKAETGAVGRALAMLGYGTQFAPELDEAERDGEKRIVDSPVSRAPIETDVPSQHWCSEHSTAFFKKGKMKGYAHPHEGGWCNEPDPAMSTVVSEAAEMDRQLHETVYLNATLAPPEAPLDHIPGRSEENRGVLLVVGERLGWPRGVAFKPGSGIVAGREGWEKFIQKAKDEEIETALANARRMLEEAQEEAPGGDLAF